MKTLCFALCALFLVANVCLNAVSVDSSAGGISIGTEARLGEKGVPIGYEYWVHNDNSYGVWLTVELIDSHNVEETLLKHEVYVAPHSTVYLGEVEQKDPAAPFAWRYRWEARVSYHDEAAEKRR